MKTVLLPRGLDKTSFDFFQTQLFCAIFLALKETEVFVLTIYMLYNADAD